MTRICHLLIVAVFAALPLLADSATDAGNVVTKLATDLSGNNPAGFLKPIDHEMPGYAKLREQVEALLGRAEVSSSISILENEGDDARRTLSLDWYMEIRSRGTGDKTEPRRRAVRCVLAKSGKAWRVVELDPAGLFE